MALPWIDASDTMEPNSELGAIAAQRASWILYMLTGQKYPGIQIHTDVYSFDTFAGGNAKFQPAMHEGNIYNIPRNAYGIRRLRLRQTPVLSVDNVKYRGVDLSPTSYSLRNKAYIILNGGMEWFLDPVNELEVTYEHGTPPPKAGISSAIRLANEFILSETDPAACALPERVTSISRQGMNIAMLDPQDFLEKGRTGISEIDAFISAANPTRSLKKAKVFSPDKPRGERIN